MAREPVRIKNPYRNQIPEKSLYSPQAKACGETGNLPFHQKPTFAAPNRYVPIGAHHTSNGPEGAIMFTFAEDTT